ncbi:hypothetical protein BDA96_04G146900 [Sorghum bicolor]|uniref:Uncharacterized protein n=1 Tax=Sorghum bicolor TaxID=4558 RepID=A0A921R4Q3_SORBI|nr:hypothetical protein BDA96_04G146900 [Sorghum bicolor]
MLLSLDEKSGRRAPTSPCLVASNPGGWSVGSLSLPHQMLDAYWCWSSTSVFS